MQKMQERYKGSMHGSSYHVIKKTNLQKARLSVRLCFVLNCQSSIQ